jgi:hypothetical protein
VFRSVSTICLLCMLVARNPACVLYGLPGKFVYLLVIYNFNLSHMTCSFFETEMLTACILPAIFISLHWSLTVFA